MVPRQVLVAHRWMSVLCREGVNALRSHSSAAHAYADWSSLLLCVERLFSGPPARVRSASLHQSGSSPICERMQTVTATTADSVVFKTQV